MENYYNLLSRIYYIQIYYRLLYIYIYIIDYIQLKNLKKLLIQYTIFSYYTKKVHIKFLS